MSKIITADITLVTRGVILHQVNCQDAMGAGVAKALYTKWPTIKTSYHEVANNTTPEERFGNMQSVLVSPYLMVINSFSQFSYGNAKITGQVYTSEELLVHNIHKAAAYAACYNMSLYIPDHVGCGLAGGNWDTLSSRISDIPNLVIVRKPS